MKTLIDFIVEAPSNEELAAGARDVIEKAASAEEIVKWFAGKGYIVSSQEAVRMIENKDKIAGENVKFTY